MGEKAFWKVIPEKRRRIFEKSLLFFLSPVISVISVVLNVTNKNKD
ncbi:hypothetical protein [Methanosarcina sp.]|nr:hypothetical protein [Methanosarcina sp.]MDW5555230.1 hypothetical protein [Methanosarcina sp.]